MAAQAHELCDRLRGAARLACALEIAAVEDGGPDALTALVGRLGELLQQTLSALASIEDDPDWALGLPDASLPDSKQTGKQAIDEFAFVARLELCHAGDWVFEPRCLVEFGPTLIRCERLRDHLVAIVSEVEAALCEHVGTRSELVDLIELQLERTRATRGTYFQFTASIEALRARLEARELDHAEVLDESTRAVAALIEDPVFVQLRYEARRRVEQLHRRLLTWARVRVHDELEARRLWSDLQTCVELFATIQIRPELMVHDWEFAGELLWTAKLEACLASQDPRLLELGTRDPLLHAAIEHGRSAEIGRLIERLHDQLAGALGRPSLAARRSASNVASI